MKTTRSQRAPCACCAGDAFSDPAVREQLFEHEPGLWGYFVEGAPVHLLETIKSVRKLVNGSPALLDSLQVRSAADRTVLEQAYRDGYDGGELVTLRGGNGGKMVTLAEAPEAVNVIVGGTRAARKQHKPKLASLLFWPQWPGSISDRTCLLTRTPGSSPSC